MKKILALLMTLALIVSAVTLPALAESGDQTTDRTVSATRESGQRGPGGRPPQGRPGNGQNNQSGPDGQQPPTQPGNGQNDQAGPDGQQPPTQPGNGQDGQGNRNGQRPPKRPGKNARSEQNAPGNEPEKRLDFDQLVKDNVISQDVCDAILNYMKEHAPQGQPEGNTPTEGSQPPAKPEENTTTEGSEPLARPEGDQNAPAGMEEQLLKELLDNNVITQEVYDLLIGMLTPAETTADTTDTAASDA